VLDRAVPARGIQPLQHDQQAEDILDGKQVLILGEQLCALLQEAPASGRVTGPVAAGSWSRPSLTVLSSAIRMGSTRSLMNRRHLSKDQSVIRRPGGIARASWSLAFRPRY
jgi:hypothetical protein